MSLSVPTGERTCGHGGGVIGEPGGSLRVMPSRPVTFHLEREHGKRLTSTKTARGTLNVVKVAS
ncbi:MAG TPA: hypothetical protein VMB74_19665 [Streptosporangiaceae bacterium]|nr:hypothetical protein [Streptosporangiaceae bacterium]